MDRPENKIFKHYRLDPLQQLITRFYVADQIEVLKFLEEGYEERYLPSTLIDQYLTSRAKIYEFVEAVLQLNEERLQRIRDLNEAKEGETSHAVGCEPTEEHPCWCVNWEFPKKEEEP